MKLALASLPIALLSSMVIAAAPDFAQPTQAVPSAAVATPSAERLELARRFMRLTDGDDPMEAMRSAAVQAASAGLDDPDDQAAAKRFMDRVMVLAEPKLRERMPEINETYAQLYAREFSAEELQQMIVFAASPAGKHYLAQFQLLDLDPTVLKARQGIWEDLTPIMEDVRKQMCAEKAAQRIAAGDKKAKCPLSQPETMDG